MTLLFITHDIALASGFADRIAVFREARLVEAGPTARCAGAAEAGLHAASALPAISILPRPPLIAEAAA